MRALTTSPETKLDFLRSRLRRVISEELGPSVSSLGVINVSHALLPSAGFSRVRTLIAKTAGMQVGSQSLMQGPLRITGSSDTSLIRIGSSTLVSGALHVDLGGRVTIGDGVRIGHNVTLLTVSHELGEPSLRAGATVNRPVTIGDGAWIASGVTVLPGVTIGAGSVVAAGSVVSRDVEPNTLVAGVPARLVRKLVD